MSVNSKGKRLTVMKSEASDLLDYTLQEAERLCTKLIYLSLLCDYFVRTYNNIARFLLKVPSIIRH